MDNQIKKDDAQQPQLVRENNEMFNTDSNASSVDNSLGSKKKNNPNILLMIVTVLLLVSFGINIFLFATKSDSDSSNAQSQMNTTDTKPTVLDNNEVDDEANDQAKDLKETEDEENPNEITENDGDVKPSNSNLPILSDDKKSIISSEDEEILSVDNNTIFDWFKNQSQLCDGYNLTSTPDRKDFCESKNIFKEKTKFKSIIVSPTGKEIGFTIESEALTPDTVVGIFSQSTNTVELLTNYYLGNEFISFSPDGTNFIYKGNCGDAMCGLFVIDSKTFVEKASINNEENLEYRTSDAEFIKWISDNEVEYKLKSSSGGDVKIERKLF